MFDESDIYTLLIHLELISTDIMLYKVNYKIFQS